MFTQLLLFGFLCVPIDGKLKIAFILPHQKIHTFLPEGDVGSK